MLNRNVDFNGVSVTWNGVVVLILFQGIGIPFLVSFIKRIMLLSLPYCLTKDIFFNRKLYMSLSILQVLCKKSGFVSILSFTTELNVYSSAARCLS